MQPKSQISLGYSAHKASAPRSPTSKFEELNYSTQAMQPRSQFSSGSLAHKASAPRSLAAQFDELDYSTQAMQPKSQFSSGKSAHEASAYQFEKLNPLNSGHVAQEPVQLRRDNPPSLSNLVLTCSTEAS